MSIKLQGEYYGIAEAAQIIGVSTSRLRQMIREEGVRAICISERVWLMESAEVERVKAIPQKTGRPRAAS